MNLSEEQYELIEAYLTNELSEADRRLFEEDMQTDPELQIEVDRQREIRLGLRALGIERVLERAKTQYKATLLSTETSVANQPAAMNQPIVRPLTSWRYWAAAASVVIVLGAGYFTYRQTTNRQADLAYAETYSSDAANELMKDFPTGNVSPAVREQFRDAMTSYRAGKYDQVIDQLRTLPADKETIHFKNYFLGLSYLANKESAKAIPLLTKAQLAPSAKLRQKADWFLALAYVKNGQKEKALPMLKRISTDKANPFQSLAQQVLKKID